ncbi:MULTISPECIES: Gfo/Idh/MocA family protein [Bacillaceae]|uniref:Gfo/Idh/MocA family protein n=1 Tax=Bacillaceae TaxID=186817 RepID=UPI000B9BEEB7|nr:MULTISPECIES: Gfo/Idh/MocA family oxidoreductase [Bacillus]OXT14679.1 dehydrogenase [Bacillus sp. OG2]MCP1157352.1 Gfo/Idh/MocA family oxidoreductase [Bacillus infantis]MDT0163009.1 Gfo/Idh/MocA family oxidoreductase [Bacillus sp. AG4(2022)]MDW2877242.1 Gfo/Idh/MocA family oxidoreductase [Bacillus infantis]RYI27154.1 Gfo/Idh/MocA family oxidoreductase [Bacillus infantis]
MEKLRVGIIGAGGIAQSRHIPALLTLSELASVEAICDIHEETARLTAEKFGVPHAFGDYQDMLEIVDAVVICTPNRYHAEISVAALKAGKHVLCEKPMAMTAEECEEMIKASKKSGKQLAIAYHYRFMKEARAAKKVIEENEIGQPIVARAKALRRRKVPGWGVFTNKELQGGGAMIDYGCHFLDLALWLLGSPEPVEVTGTAYNQLSRMEDQVNLWGDYDHQTIEVEDHVTAYIRFANGASLLFETSWMANIKNDEESLGISGLTGGIDVFPFQLNQLKNGMLLNSEAEWLPGEEDPGIPQARNFLNSCLGKEQLIVKPEEALRVSKIIDAIYKSSETGKSIVLE